MAVSQKPRAEQTSNSGRKFAATITLSSNRLNTLAAHAHASMSSRKALVLSIRGPAHSSPATPDAMKAKPR